MEQLLEKLGIEPHIFIAQIINFLILLFVLRKFLYKPLLNILEKRKTIIDKGLQDAKEAAENLREIESIKEEKIIEAEKEANQIIEKFKKEAQEKSAVILKETQEKSEDIVKEAKEIAAEEKKEILRNLKQEIGDLVILASGRILEKHISRKENEEIINQQLELLNKN